MPLDTSADAGIRRLDLRRAHLLAQLEYLVGSAEALPAKVTDMDLARIDACDPDVSEMAAESPPEEPEASVGSRSHLRAS